MFFSLRMRGRGRQGAHLTVVEDDAPRFTLSIVVPMFREERRIAACVARLEAAALDPGAVEVVFVDDGSDDATVGVLAAAVAPVSFRHRVIRLAENYGKGAAVRAGALAAAGEVVAFTDADLSTDVAEVLRAARHLRATGADVVIASRAHDDSEILHPQPLGRRACARSFNVAVRALGLSGVRDTQCGLKAFTRAAAHRLFWPLRTQGFAFDIELLHRAKVAGMDVREIGVAWGHRDDSTIRTGPDGLRMLRDVLAIRLRSVHSRSGRPPGERPVELPVPGGGAGDAVPGTAVGAP